jgi:hypothetical protein
METTPSFHSFCGMVSMEQQRHFNETVTSFHIKRQPQTYETAKKRHL